VGHVVPATLPERLPGMLDAGVPSRRGSLTSPGPFAGTDAGRAPWGAGLRNRGTEGARDRIARAWRSRSTDRRPISTAPGRSKERVPHPEHVTTQVDRLLCRLCVFPPSSEGCDFGLEPSPFDFQGLKTRELGLEPAYRLLQDQNSAHARDVYSRIGECGNLAEAVNFGATVTPRPTGAASRFHEAFSLIGTKRLRVKATELSRHRDAEESAIGFGPRGAHSDHPLVKKPSGSDVSPPSSR
jgi:hypothetical protein